MSELADRLAANAPDGLTVAIFMDLGLSSRPSTTGTATPPVTMCATHGGRPARGRAGEDDLVGRLGGDEFLMVLHTADDQQALTNIANRVAEALNHDVEWEDNWISPAASIGRVPMPARARASAPSAWSGGRRGDEHASKRNAGTPAFTDAGSRLSS
jgi:hypothetical protein